MTLIVREIDPEDRLPVFRAATEADDPEQCWNTDDVNWWEYIKVVPTKMIRMGEPFKVQTAESDSEPLLCRDGYLAVDTRGYPYPIAVDEQQKIYRPSDFEAEPVKDPQASAWEARELRLRALDMAIAYVRDFIDADSNKSVVQVAEEFERYLKGEGQSLADKARGLAP